MTSGIADLDAVEAALRRWVEAAGYRSYDPYDGLSGWAGPLVRRHRLAARGLTQIVKTSPLPLRPLLGIRKRVLSKSLSDAASAALLRHRIGHDPQAHAAARAFLDRLRAERCSGFAGACWALATPYVTRYIVSPGGDPNLFWTLNAATAFLEAYELDGQEADLAIARSALDFIREDLGVVEEGDGVWLRYFAGHDAVVYNVAALGGALFRRVARYTGERELAAIGEAAIRFVVRHQNEDGSWFYARGPQGRWVDGFHTGYVLEALLQGALLDRDPQAEAALERGVAFYERALFTAGDLPRYAADRTYPLDVQNCAQAIQTLARLAWRDRRHLEHATRVARAVLGKLFRWTAGRTQGYFVLGRGRWITNALPAVRWGEAPMLLALASLQAAHADLPPSWELVRVGDSRHERPIPRPS